MSGAPCAALGEPSPVLSLDALVARLPHRPPFRFVDRVSVFEAGIRVVAHKDVTATEWFFAPDAEDAATLVMPDLLVVEAMAQAGAVLLMADTAHAAAKVVYFAGLDRVQWHAPVRAGDCLCLHVAVTHARGRLRKVHAEARVHERVVCEADLAAVLMDAS